MMYRLCAILALAALTAAAIGAAVPLSRAQSPPVANAGPARTAVVDNPTGFNGSASIGSNLTYHWDFGDGTSGSGMIVDHVYEVSGIYHIVLTVTDDMAQTARDTTRRIVFDIEAVCDERCRAVLVPPPGYVICTDPELNVCPVFGDP